MLTEERYAAILRLLDDRGAVSVLQLTGLLGSSESTIRRDLAALHAQGRLIKVHGGATALRGEYRSREYPIFTGEEAHAEEKNRIARHAASLISSYDLVFLDAGTTTALMAEHIAAENVTFITSGLRVAKSLAQRGFSVSVTGGRVQPTTEALVGGEAVNGLTRYHFAIGFFGANGISLEAGCTTPDADEARVKTTAMAHCRRCYLLADSSKFGVTTAVTFAHLGQATILTGEPVDARFREAAPIVMVRA